MRIRTKRPGGSGGRAGMRPAVGERSARMSGPLTSERRDEFVGLAGNDVRLEDLEESFDRVTRLLGTVLQVPHVAIVILGHRHAWTMSSFGIERVHRIDRTVSFCPRVVAAGRLLVIQDARQDPRHAYHPLVDRPEPLFFYAGVPLVMPGGAVVGSLSIHDRRRRRLSRRQRQLLADCAAIVASEMELRRQIREQARAEAAVRAERSRLGRVIDSLPFDFWLCDAQGRYILQNAVGRALWGLHLGQTPGETGVAAEIANVWAENNRRALAGQMMRGDFTYRIGDRIVQVEEIVAPVRDEQGQIDGLVGVGIDNSERKAAERARRESEAKLATAIESLPFGLWIQDVEGRYVMQNAPTRARWGDLLGKRMIDLDMPPAMKRRWQANFEQVLQGRHLRMDETYGAGGDVCHLDTILVPIEMDGQVIGVVGVNIDVTERKITEQRLHHLAHHDVLTGLPNRRAFQERLVQAVGRGDRHGQIAALLLVDLDAFKDVNDTLGHDAGDALLLEVASRLRHARRRQDTVARLGGDEFAVILDAVRRPTDAAVIASRILAELARPFSFEGQELRPRASIGIAVFPNDAATAGDLLKHADIALYRAKESGRGRWRFFDDEMRVQVETRRRMERELRRAVGGPELALRYEPVVRPDADGRISFDATVRWLHPQQGSLEQESFLPIAEESGLMGTLIAGLLHHALEDAGWWQGAGLALERVTVRLGPASVTAGELYRIVDQALSGSQVAPDHLEIGISEAMLLGRDGAAIGEVLQALHQRGVSLSLTDFGASHASLLQLRRLPIDRLHISPGFVQAAIDNQGDAAIIQAIIELAHGLGIETVAEGVAEARQLDFLLAQGCDLVQGPLLGTPLPADQALAHALARPWAAQLQGRPAALND
jgi:diguanylate cyclase (GGDEF)-like protein/PAS domain S-box-containing protein